MTQAELAYIGFRGRGVRHRLEMSSALLVTPAAPVRGGSGGHHSRDELIAICVTILVAIVLLIAIWKCIGYLKEHEEKSSRVLRLPSCEHSYDAEATQPSGDTHRHFQIIPWSSPENLGPPPGYQEDPPPAYSSLVFNKKRSVSRNGSVVEPQVFKIAI
ncbi:uncharacterized protein [Periplaneta americana]|uniref:uncharacterized protein n=1 Tax=Periplaneta americana TaxID=6978 RepID=UPI0037E925A0